MEIRLPGAAGAGIDEETGGVMLGALWVALCGSPLEDSHGPEGQGAVRGHPVFSTDRFPVVQKLPSGNNIGTHSLFLDWVTEAEDNKKRWQEYTEELHKIDLHEPDNHEGVITHLESESWNVKSSGP